MRLVAEANSKAKVKKEVEAEAIFSHQGLPDFQTLKLASTIEVKCNNVCKISALVSAIVFNVCAALNYRH